MLGKGHLLVGSCGWLAVGAPLLAASGHELGAAELAAGTVVCAGAAMLPDLDHPQATVSRSLGPITGAISRLLAKVAGGHRNGTHSLLFVALVGCALAAGLAASPGPWLALGICFFFSSLVLRTLTEADGAVCAALSALVGASLISVAPDQDWIWIAVVAGCLLHMLGDILTPEGVPPLWPISRVRISIPIIGHTGDWRERVIGAICGLAACWLLATGVFLAQWQQTDRTPTRTHPSRSAADPDPAESPRTGDRQIY